MPLGLAPNGLPQSTKWLFPEYEFARMNLDEYVGVIIERILNRGEQEEIVWVFEQYGRYRVTQWVRQHGYRLLDYDRFVYWRSALGIKRYKVPPWEKGHERTKNWNQY